MNKKPKCSSDTKCRRGNRRKFQCGALDEINQLGFSRQVKLSWKRCGWWGDPAGGCSLEAGGRGAFCLRGLVTKPGTSCSIVACSKMLIMEKRSWYWFYSTKSSLVFPQKDSVQPSGSSIPHGRRLWSVCSDSPKDQPLQDLSVEGRAAPGFPIVKKYQSGWALTGLEGMDLL